MNCASCGAPLTVVGHGGTVVCRFCRTEQRLRPADVHQEGVVDLQHASDRGCPACGSGLRWGTMDECRIEHCPDCEGLLLEGDVFREVIAGRRASYAGPEAEPTPVDAALLTIQRTCTGCNKPMDTHAYYGPGNSVIDSCSRCDLIWLDQGESTDLVRAPGRRHS